MKKNVRSTLRPLLIAYKVSTWSTFCSGYMGNSLVPFSSKPLHQHECWSAKSYGIHLRTISQRYAIYYLRTSNINWTLVGNEIVDHSDVVGASPVHAAPTTFHSRLNTRHQSIGEDICKMRWETFQCWALVWLILEVWLTTKNSENHQFSIAVTFHKVWWVNPLMFDGDYFQFA